MYNLYSRALKLSAHGQDMQDKRWKRTTAAQPKNKINGIYLLLVFLVCIERLYNTVPVFVLCYMEQHFCIYCTSNIKVPLRKNIRVNKAKHRVYTIGTVASYCYTRHECWCAKKNFQSLNLHNGNKDVHLREIPFLWTILY